MLIKKNLAVCLVLYLCVAVNCEVNETNSAVANTPKKRLKRYLGFKQGARVFFRINVKDNVLKVNQVWAHAYGFRQNFDIPFPLPKEYKVKKRDVHDSLEVMLNHHGFDGRSCVLRAFCEASQMVTPRSGIFLKLFRMVFSIPKGDEHLYPYLNSNDCEELEKHCPISLMDISPYTDI